MKQRWRFYGKQIPLFDEKSQTFIQKCCVYYLLRNINTNTAIKLYRFAQKEGIPALQWHSRLYIETFLHPDDPSKEFNKLSRMDKQEILKIITETVKAADDDFVPTQVEIEDKSKPITIPCINSMFGLLEQMFFRVPLLKTVMQASLFDRKRRCNPSVFKERDDLYC